MAGRLKGVNSSRWSHPFREKNRGKTVISTAINHYIARLYTMLLDPIQFRPLCVLQTICCFSKEISKEKSNPFTRNFTVDNRRPKSELLKSVKDAITNSPDRPSALRN